MTLCLDLSSVRFIWSRPSNLINLEAEWRSSGLIMAAGDHKYHGQYGICRFHFTSAQGLGISILLLQLSRSHHCEHFELQKHLPQMNINAKNDF